MWKKEAIIEKKSLKKWQDLLKQILFPFPEH